MKRLMKRAECDDQRDEQPRLRAMNVEISEAQQEPDRHSNTNERQYQPKPVRPSAREECKQRGRTHGGRRIDRSDPFPATAESCRGTCDQRRIIKILAVTPQPSAGVKLSEIRLVGQECYS